MCRTFRPTATLFVARAVTHLAAALRSVLLKPKEALSASKAKFEPNTSHPSRPLGVDRQDSAPSACARPVPIEEEETAAAAEDTSENEETANTEELTKALSACPAEFEPCTSHPSRPLGVDREDSAPSASCCPVSPYDPVHPITYLLSPVFSTIP
jgi:hypothetical protein